jgi:hypothetical protein
MFHWTIAELNFLNRALKRIKSGEYTQFYMDNNKMNFDNNEKKVKVQKELNDLIDRFELSTIWVDMCEIFQKEPIVIKGSFRSFRFKLKDIGKAFYDKGYIQTKWDDNELSNGFLAMLSAIEIYRKTKNVSHTHKKYKEIIRYNEIDCKVIWEIVGYLRHNNI